MWRSIPPTGKFVIAVGLCLMFLWLNLATASNDRFTVGPYWGLPDEGEELSEHLSLWVDTFKASWAFEYVSNASRADTFEAWGFKLYAHDVSAATIGWFTRENFIVLQTDSSSYPAWFESWWGLSPGIWWTPSRFSIQ